ncbi:hypothetical protein HDU81_010282 [Chytriomyces hyalinus]|nr:hypothetical protein HDU81_010282 [Chytriomyces hyalinus]
MNASMGTPASQTPANAEIDTAPSMSKSNAVHKSQLKEWEKTFYFSLVPLMASCTLTAQSKELEDCLQHLFQDIQHPAGVSFQEGIALARQLTTHCYDCSAAQQEVEDLTLHSAAPPPATDSSGQWESPKHSSTSPSRPVNAPYDCSIVIISHFISLSFHMDSAFLKREKAEIQQCIHRKLTVYHAVNGFTMSAAEVQKMAAVITSSVKVDQLHRVLLAMIAEIMNRPHMLLDQGRRTYPPLILEVAMVDPLEKFALQPPVPLRNPYQLHQMSSNTSFPADRPSSQEDL